MGKKHSLEYLALYLKKVEGERGGNGRILALERAARLAIAIDREGRRRLAFAYKNSCEPERGWCSLYRSILGYKTISFPEPAFPLEKGNAGSGNEIWHKWSMVKN